MRKVLLLFIICLCISSTSYAAPSYGTRMPQARHFFAGLQTYSVLNRSMENDYGKISSLENFFLLSYGVLDGLAIDAKAGAGNINQHLETSAALKYSTFLGGGYGFRVRLYDSDKTKMVFGFQHISIHPHTISIDGSKHKAVLDNWQFSFLASYEFLHFTPYMGTSWSWLNNIHWLNTVRKLEKSDLGKSVALIIGTDIPLGKKLWFNVEGQFFSETSVSASLNFAF